MGWSGGSEMLYDVLSTVYPLVPKEKRVIVCTKLMKIFEQQDCDTIEEAFDKKWPELEAVYRKAYPTRFEDEE